MKKKSKVVWLEIVGKECMNEQCKTHENWLILMEFGLKILLEDQQLLVGLIFREATREAGRETESALLNDLSISKIAAKIFQDLNLKIEVIPTV